jgi:hypothetical protein
MPQAPGQIKERVRLEPDRSSNSPDRTASNAVASPGNDAAWIAGFAAMPVERC